MVAHGMYSRAADRPYQRAETVLVGQPYTTSRGLIIDATGAGVVVIRMFAGDNLTLNVPVGVTALDGYETQEIVSSTATATFQVLR